MKQNLRNIGRIAAFTMASAAFAADPAGKLVIQAYEDTLGRAPNRIEYNTWLNYAKAGGSRTQFAAYLTSSAEYRGRLAEGWYQQFLARDATAGELNFAGQMMMNGASDKEMRAILIGLDEYYRRAGGSNERFVHQLYADLLGRAPTPAEANAIIAVLVSNNLIGLLQQQAAMLVQGTVEFEQRQLTDIYQKYLRRNPYTAELNFGVQMLLMDVPEEFEIDKVMGSDEYLNFANHN